MFKKIISEESRRLNKKTAKAVEKIGRSKRLTINQAINFTKTFPRIEYSFVEKAKSFIQIVRGEECSVTTPYGPERGKVAIHNHPGGYLEDVAPSLADLHVAANRKVPSALMTPHGLTVYKGVKNKKYGSYIRDLGFIASGISFLGNLNFFLFGKLPIISFLIPLGFLLTALVFSFINKRINKRIDRHAKLFLCNHYKFFEWRDLEQTYGRRANVFNIVRNMTDRYFYDFYNEVMSPVR